MGYFCKGFGRRLNLSVQVVLRLGLAFLSVDRFDKASFTEGPSRPRWSAPSFRFRNACVGSDAPMQRGFNSERASLTLVFFLS